MKILFVTNNLYPYLNANSEICYKLASVLKSEYDCYVTVLGYSDKERPETPNPYHVNEYEIEAIGVGRRIMARRENRVIKLLRLLSHPNAFIYVFHPEKHPWYILKTHYAKAIRRICKLQRIDCIVCFKNPNDTIAGAIEANVDVPIIAYELDPWENCAEQTDEELSEQQYELEKHCAAIITTKLLYPNYMKPECKIPSDRVFSAEFPNIVEYAAPCKKTFTDGKIHCVFTGQLYDDIRNPKFTIELFSKLADKNIVLDIFGNDNGCLKDIDLPDNIVYHGEVSSDEAMSYLFAADVVVNIGNTLVYMLPSKILTYVSMGKPILNIIKSTKCPTLSYLDKYPLAKTILEKEYVSDNDIKEIISFCKSAPAHIVEFNDVKAIFSDATPRHVGRILYDVICKCK